MAISRFQSAFKVRTDMMDNITPNNTVQMNASVPAGEWKPASWLPVIWQNEASKDYFTISSGKVVSFDSTGRIVPSGLLRRIIDQTNRNDTFVEYTDEDKKAKVIDITTGDFVTGAKVVKNSEAMAAVLAHGWVVDNSAAPLNPGGSDADTVAVGKLFISAPVGIAAYDVYVWAGDDPANLHFTNYQKQHLIQFFTDIQMRVGHVCDNVASDVFTLDDKVAGAALQALLRYDHLDLSDVMAYEWSSKLAQNTSRTPVTLTTGAGAWVGRYRSDVSLLSRAGDWAMDADAGRIFFFLAGGAANVPDDANGQALTGLTAFDYAGAASTDEQMMHLVGDAAPGDFVTFDKNSNFKVLAPLDLAATASGVAAPNMGGNDAADSTAVKSAIDAAVDALKDKLEAALEARSFEESLVVGRVFELQKEPRGLLERVRTGWKGEEFGKDAQMPGSATNGFSDLITLSDERIADEIVIVNVKIQ